MAEPADRDRGGSSTLPQKRNPVGSALAIALRPACPRRGLDPARRDGAGARARRRRLAGRVGGTGRRARVHGRGGGGDAGGAREPGRPAGAHAGEPRGHGRARSGGVGEHGHVRANRPPRGLRARPRCLGGRSREAARRATSCWRTPRSASALPRGDRRRAGALLPTSAPATPSWKGAERIGRNDEHRASSSVRRSRGRPVLVLSELAGNGPGMWDDQLPALR